MAELIQSHVEELREKNIEQIRRDAIEKAVTAEKKRFEEGSSTEESAVIPEGKK